VDQEVVGSSPTSRPSKSNPAKTDQVQTSRRVFYAR